MPCTPALDIEGLTVRYGATLAVDDLDLRIDPGETVALLGSNGAGKSSTLNAALGLFRPTAGRVRLLGREPLDAIRAGGVGAMLQHGGLPSETRVGEVLELVRRQYGTPWPAAGTPSSSPPTTSTRPTPSPTGWSSSPAAGSSPTARPAR